MSKSVMLLALPLPRGTLLAGTSGSDYFSSQSARCRWISEIVCKSLSPFVGLETSNDSSVVIRANNASNRSCWSVAMLMVKVKGFVRLWEPLTDSTLTSLLLEDLVPLFQRDAVEPLDVCLASASLLTSGATVGTLTARQYSPAGYTALRLRCRHSTG